MGQVVQKNLPCLNLDCGSSDARQLYEGDTSFCFSCKKFFPANYKEVSVDKELEDTPYTEKSKIPKAPKAFRPYVKIATLEEIKEYNSRGFVERKITKPITEYYNVKVSYNEDGDIDTHYYPYGLNAAEPTGYKIRKLPKEFSSTGKLSSLFGQAVFPKGGKRVIITEGELDAMSIAQAYYEKYTKVYPVVSIRSASAINDLVPAREWLRAYEEVLLCFDNDSAGQEALSKAIKIIGADKVKIIRLPVKDASDMLLEHGGKALLNAVYDAEKWSPAGIIGKDALKKAMKELNSKVAVPYPECLTGINNKIKGMREAEIALFISGTGSGKSTIIREIMLHILATTNSRVGVISLEETPGETARNLSAMAIRQNAAEEIKEEELDNGFEKVFGTDRVTVLDHQGSIKDESIIDQLEYMCLIGCKYLFIDHITILVSEGAENLTGNEAIDKIMNDLLRVVKKHSVWIGLVSHLRKSTGGGRSFEEGRLPSVDDIRGSGSIKQVSMDIIAFARNMTAPDEIERNSIIMSILKSRSTGKTGPVPGAYYESKTGRLSRIEQAPDEDFGIE
jgi:twinkle protein